MLEIPFLELSIVSDSESFPRRRIIEEWIVM